MVQIKISKRAAFLVLLAVLLLVPATAVATHVFDDVSDSNVHAEGIEFMKDSGVSIGCQDGTVYCPSDPVTREQMATFMYRLSGNDPGTARSVDADQLDGLDANQLVRAAFGSSDDAPDANGNIVTAAFTAPVPGWVLMGGGVNAVGNTEDEYNCQLFLDGNPVLGTFRSAMVHDSGGTNNSRENCSATGGSAITLAGAHTVALNIGGRNTVQFDDATVWALYVPFGGEGQGPIIIIPFGDEES